MKKSITIIGVNYFPENTAIGLYTTQLAEYLTTKDIEVNVVTGFPYYPSWKIDASYQKKSVFFKEKINNVTVFRYKQYVPQNPTFVKRILHLIDFTLGSIVNILKVRKTDVVLCVVPFTSTIFLGKVLSVFKKAKLWVHVQDFEFDAAIETNLVSSNNVFFKGLFKLEKTLLKNADVTSTISLSMVEKLVTKCSNDNEKLLLPNWVDISNISPQNSEIHPKMTSKKFKILYSGNIGEKQDWSFFLEFAKKIQNLDGIEIIVVGDGGKKNWLLNEIAEYSFIKHYYPVPYKDLSNLLCSADLHILFQKENVQDTVMPSKILAMMASAKPSLITGNMNSEVATIIKESKAGKYFQSNQITEILAYISTLKDKSNVVSYGENARKYVSKKYEKGSILNQFHQTFLNLID